MAIQDQFTLFLYPQLTFGLYISYKFRLRLACGIRNPAGVNTKKPWAGHNIFVMRRRLTWAFCNLCCWAKTSVQFGFRPLIISAFYPLSELDPTSSHWLLILTWRLPHHHRRPQPTYLPPLPVCVHFCLSGTSEAGCPPGRELWVTGRRISTFTLSPFTKMSIKY